MKKYVKPELFYERFELTEHIAVCAFDSMNRSGHPESCAFTGSTDKDAPEVTIFLNGNAQCEWPLDSYCYYTGTNGMNTFNS